MQMRMKIWAKSVIERKQRANAQIYYEWTDGHTDGQREICSGCN